MGSCVSKVMHNTVVTCPTSIKFLSFYFGISTNQHLVIQSYAYVFSFSVNMGLGVHQ